MTDWILWNRRPTDRDPGDIDEIVMTGVTVHIEQMSDRSWSIVMYRLTGDGYKAWLGNFIADSRGRMEFVEQENSGIEWDDDCSHEESRTVQPSVPEYPSPDDLLGADPEWTGGVSVDEYMNRARRRPEGER